MATVFCEICEAKYNLKPSRRIPNNMIICYSCRRKTAPDEFRCLAKTQKGDRCKKWKRPSRQTCANHRGVKI